MRRPRLDQRGALGPITEAHDTWGTVTTAPWSAPALPPGLRYTKIERQFGNYCLAMRSDGNIVAWVEQLGEVDTSGVEPMTAVIPQALRLRDDVVDADPLTGGGIRDKVLANAPAAEHGFFAVPKVIE